MPNNTFGAAILGTCDDPLLFRVEAIGVRCASDLVEDSFLDEGWSLLYNHSNLDEMTFL